jgi:hypothetical protein
MELAATREERIERLARMVVMSFMTNSKDCTWIPMKRDVGVDRL